MGIKRKTGGQSQSASPGKTTMTLDSFLENELTPLAGVVSFCNNLPMSIYADTTVVKSPETVFRGLVLSRNRMVAEDYLLNYRRSSADLGVLIGTNNYKMPMAVGAVAVRELEENEEDCFALPPPRNERAPLGPVIRSRRSIRKYSGKAVSLEELSTVLAHTAGITAQRELGDAPRTKALGEDPKLDLRATESGGGLYPIDLCIVALNIDKLPVGCYRYLPKSHALKPIKSTMVLPEPGKLAQFGEIQVENSAFVFGYVYNLWENSRKYGEAGLAFAFIEAGGMAAHVHLLCTALGLGSCDVGGFSKPVCDRLFAADGLSRHTIHMTVIGKP